LPSAPLRTVPLFTASRPDVRQSDTHSRRNHSPRRESLLDL
jgi:hypothetical protein